MRISYCLFSRGRLHNLNGSNTKPPSVDVLGDPWKIPEDPSIHCVHHFGIVSCLEFGGRQTIAADRRRYTAVLAVAKVHFDTELNTQQHDTNDSGFFTHVPCLHTFHPRGPQPRAAESRGRKTMDGTAALRWEPPFDVLRHHQGSLSCLAP